MDEIFNKAWAELNNIYSSGGICSERQMQFYLLTSLYKFDINKEFDFFVEPSIFDKDNNLSDLGLKNIIPDILVTKGREIVAVVELKFIPHSYIQYKKDIKNMSAFYVNRHNKDLKFYLKINPINGQWDYNSEYVLSNDLKLIYCAIGNKYSECFTATGEIWSKKEITGINEVPNFIQYNGMIGENKVIFERYLS